MTDTTYLNDMIDMIHMIDIIDLFDMINMSSVNDACQTYMRMHACTHTYILHVYVLAYTYVHTYTATVLCSYTCLCLNICKYIQPLCTIVCNFIKIHIGFM